MSEEINKTDFPELSEEGIKLGQEAVIRVREEFKKAAINVLEQELSDMYTNLAQWMDGDIWSNYKAHVIRFVSGYVDISKYESLLIRNMILAENRDELIADLNQDMVNEIQRLKEQVVYLQNDRRLY